MSLDFEIVSTLKPERKLFKEFLLQNPELLSDEEVSWIHHENGKIKINEEN